jgi:hypothetical protein
MVTFLNSHTLLFEKLIFPTMSKTGLKTQGILGVKSQAVPRAQICKCAWINLLVNTDVNLRLSK